MAIKAGQFLHDVHGFVVDRIQQAGAPNLNIPEEKIYELGNYQTVATVRDIPDLSFDIESLDVSTEIEALLTGKDPTTISVGQQIDFATALPLDIISPFKSGNGAFDIVKGIAVPNLTMEQIQYRFGIGANASQQVTLRGDSLFYIPGTPKFQKFANTTGGALSATAIPYVEKGVTQYALTACFRNPTTGAYKRLVRGVDYTDTASSITITATGTGYTETNVVFGTLAAANYLQTVHQGTSVKPAAVRAKDIDIYVSTAAATTVLARWSGVQQFEVSRRVNLQNDEEFGNSKYVSQDYDTADVTGSITVKSVDTADLWAKVAQVANVAATNAVAGPYSSAPLALEARISDPDTGTLLKTLYVPDARFTLPGAQGRVQTKLEVTFNFTSDAGSLFVYRGAR